MPACRFSGVEKLKDKAAAAAQAILEPGIATDGGQQMSRQQFGIFIRRFAAASGVSFSAITDFLLVVPVFDYDPAFMDPGEPVHPMSCINLNDTVHVRMCYRCALRLGRRQHSCFVLGACLQDTQCAFSGLYSGM